MPGWVDFPFLGDICDPLYLLQTSQFQWISLVEISKTSNDYTWWIVSV